LICGNRCVTAVTERRPAAARHCKQPAMRRPVQEILMKSNVGGIDRILRVVLGLVLIGLTLSGAIGVWGWIGIVPLATAAMGFCPLYTVLGFSTCPMKKS
jgi:hypothetical protein